LVKFALGQFDFFLKFGFTNFNVKIWTFAKSGKPFNFKLYMIKRVEIK